MSKKVKKTVMVDDEKVEVSDEVYACLRETNRKIRYFVKDLEIDKIIVEETTVTYVPAREASYDSLEAEVGEFAATGRSIEEILIDAEMKEKLYAALDTLNEDERRLIEELFFSLDNKKKSERKAAKTLGIPRMTLHDRTEVVLNKLKNILEN